MRTPSICLCLLAMPLIHAQEKPPVVIPDGWVPTPMVMEIAAQIRAADGNAAAAEFLEAQLAKKKDRRGEFEVLFKSIWKEAQFETGHADPEWGSWLNDAAFSSAYRAGYYAEAFSISQNLCARLSTAGRYGRMAEVQGIMEQALRSAGVNMAISSHPDLGSAIPCLPEIGHRGMSFALAFPDQLPEGPPAITRPTAFGTRQAQALLHFSWQRIQRGDWREGMEWHVAIRDWASDGKGAPAKGRSEPWYRATMDIADILARWGYKEEALAMLNEAVAAPYGTEYRNRSKIDLAVRQLNQLLWLGRPDPEMIPKLRDLNARIAKHIHFGKGSRWSAETVLANALLHEGLREEGEQILDRIIKEGSTGARHSRVSHWIKTGRVDGVEAELISLLRLGRENGHKISEMSLYNQYADFLEKTGRLREALAMRREVIRICRDFDIPRRLPAELAKLAILLQTLGDGEGSKKAADEALTHLPDGPLPNTYLSDARELLAKLKPATDIRHPEKTDEPQIDLQPLRSLVVPIDGVPWTSHLTLSNPGTAREHGRLRITGAAVGISMAGDTDDIVIQVADGIGEGEGTIDLTLDPATYRLVEISGAASPEAARELKLFWVPADKPNTAESTVTIDKSEANVTGAIIQAGVYQANPFYGVPIHLTYASKTHAETSPPLRFVSSQAARVEIYQLDGTPVAIDSQGNGSLLNAGDELFGESDGAGNPLVPLKEGRATFRIVVYPQAPIAKDGLQLDVEAFSDGQWSLHSRNRIEP